MRVAQRESEVSSPAAPDYISGESTYPNFMS
jgi:hypothetical protein